MAAASTSVAAKSYASRIPSFANPAAKHLLEVIERKKSNLAVSVDVTKKQDLLSVVKAVADDVCMVKTHIDIVEDFDEDLTQQLTALSEEHDFVIFEDRKFADIGNTVSLQYSSGVHRIASWSHITNAHLVPGPGIIDGLAQVGLPLGRGLLLLAEMSSKGNLAGGEYGRKCVEAARADASGFTCGFIAMDRIDERNPPSNPEEAKDFLVLTPGVGLDVTGDGKGQQYRTPDQVVRECGCDVIIVGRGIYGALLKDEAKANKDEALRSVKQQAARYKEAGWEAYLKRIGQQILHQAKRPPSPTLASTSSPVSKRRMFRPSRAEEPTQPDTSGDAALAASLEASSSTASSSRGYTLRTRSQVKVEEDQDAVTPVTRGSRSKAAAMVATPPSKRRAAKLDPSDGEDESLDDKKAAVASSSKPSPFDVSPRKTNQKPIKVNLDPSEVKPAPKRWRAQLDVLARQRRRIIAPVDEMGCEENGRDDRRADVWRVEDEEEKKKRERFTVLVSLMLSSQTKDEVTAQAVRNLQANLPLGLSLKGILEASDEEISSNINKVGFWRRKTGYLRSAAVIINSQFQGDVPKDIDELCSLPGVGPKMAFLALQSAWGINLGIGVDVHVHRMSNRLGWCKTKDPEGTRLVLQSWLPKELHHSINKTLVGFGQVVCVPVGPRCDLCDLGKQRLCPSYRKVTDVKGRKEVVLLPESEDETEDDKKKSVALGTAAVKVEGPDGGGLLMPLPGQDSIKEEQGDETGPERDVGEGSSGGSLAW